MQDLRRSAGSKEMKERQNTLGSFQIFSSQIESRLNQDSIKQFRYHRQRIERLEKFLDKGYNQQRRTADCQMPSGEQAQSMMNLFKKNESSLNPLDEMQGGPRRPLFGQQSNASVQLHPIQMDVRIPKMELQVTDTLRKNATTAQLSAKNAAHLKMRSKGDDLDMTTNSNQFLILE